MNTSQLECFIAVADHLNYAKAAEEVHLSQPAVTKKIQSLEEELEIRLLERDTRHVTLTLAGKRFYANAKSILMQERNAIASIAQLKAEQKRALIIGAHNVEIYGYIGKILARTYAETKDIKPDIVDAPFQALNLSLNSKSVDIVIGTYEVMQVAGIKDSAFHALAPSNVYCLAPGTANIEKYPYSVLMDELNTDLVIDRMELSLRVTCPDLEQYYMQNPEWQQTVSRFHACTLYCDNMEAALCMVESGIGVIFMPVPDFLINPNRFHYIPITDAHPLNYGYFYNKENENPALKVFRKNLEAYFDTL